MAKSMLASMPKMPPILRLDEDDLPAIKNWKVGETYEITIKAKMTGARVGNDYDDNEGKPTHSATFKIISAQTDDDEDATETKPSVRGAMVNSLKAKASTS